MWFESTKLLRNTQLRFLYNGLNSTTVDIELKQSFYIVEFVRTTECKYLIEFANKSPMEYTYTKIR